MPTEAKREIVAALRDELSRNSTYVVSEYRGLGVSELAEIRRALHRQNISYRVVKNRLMRIAAADSDARALSPMLSGPTAIAFGTDEVATAKAVLDATRAYKLVKVKGAVVGARAIDADAVVRLAALPPRDVLQAQLAGAMQAPIATLGGLLSANLRNLAYALGQVADAKARAGGG